MNDCTDCIHSEVCLERGGCYIRQPQTLCKHFSKAIQFETSQLSKNELGLFQKVLKLLKNYYETGLESNYVQKPFSWALFQTWKFFDRQEKPKRYSENQETQKEENK